eukprot:TRINITY_DN3167_c0_g3_i1.p1 TRINITY_DN3167_c0_g3~~TRINITY_DN3167_c0_g3_i1.p1  ORF type:complete len:139 (+),score=33.55 TRINITY_DN3167_c0_g3_i1:37-417(+)
MDRPKGVAVDLHHIYIADTYNHRVLVYAKQQGAFLFQVGQGEGNSHTRFKHPSGVSVDSEAGVLYVADGGNHRVCVYRSGDGGYIRHFPVLQANDYKAPPISVVWDAAGVLYVTISISTTICVYQC